MVRTLLPACGAQQLAQVRSTGPYLGPVQGPIRRINSFVPFRSTQQHQQPQQQAISAVSVSRPGVVCNAAAVELRTGRPKREDIITQDANNNVSDYIYEKMGANLHQRADHPIGIIKQVSVRHLTQPHEGHHCHPEVAADSKGFLQQMPCHANTSGA